MAENRSVSALLCVAVLLLPITCAPAFSQVVHETDMTVGLADTTFQSNPIDIPAGLSDSMLLIGIAAADSSGPAAWHPTTVTFAGQSVTLEAAVGDTEALGARLYVLNSPPPGEHTVAVETTSQTARLFITTVLASGVTTMDLQTANVPNTSSVSLPFPQRYRVDEHMLLFAMYNGAESPSAVVPAGTLAAEVSSGNGYRTILLSDPSPDLFAYDVAEATTDHRLIGVRLDGRPPTLLSYGRAMFQAEVNAKSVIGLGLATDSNGAPATGPRIAGAVRRTWPLPIVGDCFAGHFGSGTPSGNVDGIMGHIQGGAGMSGQRIQLGQTFENDESDAAVTDTSELLFSNDIAENRTLTMVGVAPQFNGAYALGPWYAGKVLTARLGVHVQRAADSGPVTYLARAGATESVADYVSGTLTNERTVEVVLNASPPATIHVIEFPSVIIGKGTFPTLSWQATDDDETGLQIRPLQHQFFDQTATDGLDIRLFMTRDGGGVHEFSSEAGGSKGGVSDQWLAAHLEAARWPTMFLCQWGQNDYPINLAWQDAGDAFMNRVDAIYAAHTVETPLYVYCSPWRPQGIPPEKYIQASERLFALARLPHNSQRMVFVNGFQLMEDAGGIGSPTNVHFNTTAQADLWGSSIWAELMTPPCPWDCSPAAGNGAVNIDDLLAVVSAVSTQDDGCDVAPDNGDGTFGNGVINLDDVLAVIGNFGPCPTSTP